MSKHRKVLLSDAEEEQLLLIRGGEEEELGTFQNPILKPPAVRAMGYTAPVYEKPPTDAETEAMLAIVAPNMYSYHVKYDKADLEASNKPQQLFMAYNGIGVRRTEMFNGNEVIITTKTTTAPGLRSVPEGIEFKISNKIPGSILRELIANFKAIYDRDKTESSAQVYRKKTGEYFAYFPVQRNNGANTNYSADLKAAVELRQDNILVLEAHSHAGMSAFFSSGDDSNEKSPCMYMVLGNFASARPTFVGRIKLLNQQARLDVSDIFDIPVEEDVLNFDNLPDPSPQMLENATPATYSYNNVAVKTNYGVGTGGYGAYGGYGRGYGGYNKDYDYDYEGAYAREYAKYYGDGSKYEAYSAYKKDTVGTAKQRKFDVKWLAENLSMKESEDLLELLTAKLQAKKTVEL